MTFIGALRCDRIDAPCVLDQPVNGESFLQYVKQFVVPTLQKGDMVIMDNLKSHKRGEIRRAIRAAGAKLMPKRRVPNAKLLTHDVFTFLQGQFSRQVLVPSANFTIV